MKNCFDTIIIGMGAAGLKCADELARMGRRDMVILTDDRLDGTSRNAGSDKQTYYKLTLSGDEGDSVREMAETLFDGGCVDGPNALSEAALSAKCFLRLCDLGVEFPMNQYGEYIGYKTDHDPRRRATSAGPLTSKRMTEALEKSVEDQGVEIRSGMMAVRILVKDNTAKGVICLDTAKNTLIPYFCNHLVWATGGPSDVYEHVSYPTRHHGMSGAMFLSGAAGVNLTEWQNGLGSVSPRWNVSGTYMQALPRFVSTDKDGNDEREFLLEGFKDLGEMLLSVFLKGYQWPFDVRKAFNGSSRVDLLVQKEIRNGRRVFLDFRKNPVSDQFNFDCLPKEAFSYLENAGAFLETPIERLAHMNQPAIDFYLDNGVDLHKDMLEIALCAQHMNGGVLVDQWWESTIKNLYVIGEAAGTHGVYRPGGSALNAGQVGGARAARKISRSKECKATQIDTSDSLNALWDLINACLSDFDNLDERKTEEALEMSRIAAAIREKTEISPFLERTKALIASFSNEIKIKSKSRLKELFRFYDTLVSRMMILAAMEDYIRNGGVNRGSGLYTENGVPDKNADVDPGKNKIQIVSFKNGNISAGTRDVLPIPSDDDFFENVWRDFRENKW
ncbi:MAG: FAD-binding protein [Clostridia bacterium]|nr:FAD-binding protein [Clostridia bacterium]